MGQIKQIGAVTETVADLVPTKSLILERGKNEAKRGILNVTIVFLVEKQQISPLEKNLPLRLAAR